MDYGTLCSHYLEKENPPSSDVINNLKLIDVNILKSNLNKKFRFNRFEDADKHKDWYKKKREEHKRQCELQEQQRQKERELTELC